MCHRGIRRPRVTAPVPPGPDGYRQILTWVTGVLSVQYEVIDIIETDDRIVFRAIARGVGVPQLHGPAAAGRAYEMSTIHIYRTEGTGSPNIGVCATRWGRWCRWVYCRPRTR